ncbi:hypothetical protein MKX08_005734 [Trichoderma sp. CBMAI-0020]|nr:hypothetical protein MKX08_005734 [Trichoderma sp. CBMAI-0020]
MSSTDQDSMTTSSDSSEDILVAATAAATAKLDTAQRILVNLQNAFKALERKVGPEVAPDQEQPEPDAEASVALASLGIEAASSKKEVIRLERDVVVKQREAGDLDGQDAEKLFQVQNQRYFSAGADLWRHQMNRMQFGDSSGNRSINPCGDDLTQGLMTLYKRDDFDNQNSQFPRKYNPRWYQWKGRDSGWRKDALAYYNGSSKYHRGVPRNAAWCHVIGRWHSSDFHHVAHIVPSFLHDHGFGKLLFGDRTQSLQGAGNALLLSNWIEGWFNSYDIVVIPVDAEETPITRWRAEIISPDLQKGQLVMGLFGKDVHGKELVFLNENRPVPRFLYFHFIMALIRIRDLQRFGWEAVWARYYEQRPFPTPSKYMRESMLLALATHFGTAHMHVVESWIADYGFESSIKLTEDESVEAARRVHMVVVETAERAESLGINEDSDEDSDKDSSDDSDENSDDESD